MRRRRREEEEEEEEEEEDNDDIEEGNEEEEVVVASRRATLDSDSERSGFFADLAALFSLISASKLFPIPPPNASAAARFASALLMELRRLGDV